MRRRIGEGDPADRVLTGAERTGDVEVEPVQDRAVDDARVGREHRRSARRHEAPHGIDVELGEGLARSEHEEHSDLRGIGREGVALDGRGRRAHRLEVIAKRRCPARPGVVDGRGP